MLLALAVLSGKVECRNPLSEKGYTDVIKAGCVCVCVCVCARARARNSNSTLASRRLTNRTCVALIMSTCKAVGVEVATYLSVLLKKKKVLLYFSLFTLFFLFFK